MGSIYIGEIFLTYLALGAGMLKSLDLFTREHLPARLGALAAILLGLWMMKDFFLPDVGWRLQGPPWVGDVARRSARRATVPALVVGGFLIGLCTVPCSGAAYLGVLSLLPPQPTAPLGYGYLVLYNAVFVLPLLLILAGASARPTLNRLALERAPQGMGSAGARGQCRRDGPDYPGHRVARPIRVDRR